MSNSQATDPNECTKRPPPVSVPKPPKPHHGFAQQQIEMTVCTCDDDKPQFFEKHSWSSHGRSASLVKKIDVASFCVRALAAWVPRPLIQSASPHVPTTEAKIALMRMTQDGLKSFMELTNTDISTLFAADAHTVQAILWCGMKTH